MDWWPTFGKLAGLEPPPRDWKDNNGAPIIFDGIDLSESLLGRGPGTRESFIYFNDQSFGGLRVKNYKALYTAKDTWLGQDQNLKIRGLRSVVGSRRAIRHRLQRCGANAWRLQDVAWPILRPGQWVDRPLHHACSDPVLGRAQDASEYSLPAVRSWGLRGYSCHISVDRQSAEATQGGPSAALSF